MAAAGWHGKLPSLGDFATRRLSPPFVDAWDHWLSDGLAAMRLKPDWLDRYLASPSWRFLLTPGVIGSTAWIGVLMPSVDRVGRYYPLTIAHPIAEIPPRAGERDLLWRWMTQLDDAAASALHDDWSLDAFEAALDRIGLPDSAPHDKNLSSSAAPPAFGSAASEFWRERSRGRGSWYAESGLTQPTLLGSDGLGPRALLGELFGSSGGAPAA